MVQKNNKTRLKTVRLKSECISSGLVDPLFHPVPAEMFKTDHDNNNDDRCNDIDSDGSCDNSDNDSEDKNDHKKR